MSWQKFLNSRWATALLSAGLIFVMIVTARILVQKSIVDREISKLQAQMAKINKDNDQLSSLMAYLKTPDYQEKQAREKLNLSKTGEHVVVLPQDEISGSSTADTATPSTSNFKQWFNYFFSHAN